MSLVIETSSARSGCRSSLTQAAVAAGACCLLLSVATNGNKLGTGTFSSSTTAYLAAPMDEAPAFVSDSSNLDVMLSDVRFVAQGWRWSPGSSAWIAVLVRVDALKTVGLARIGGLYGP